MNIFTTQCATHARIQRIQYIFDEKFKLNIQHVKYLVKCNSIPFIRNCAACAINKKIVQFINVQSRTLKKVEISTCAIN